MNQRFDNGSRQQRRFKRIMWIVRLAITLAMMAGLFYLVPTREIFTQLGRAEPAWLIAAFLLVLGIQWTVAVRLKILANMHDLGLSTADVLQINMAVRFYALVVPGGMVTGMAIRSLRLGHQTRKGYAGAITAVFLDRLLATLTLSAIGIVFWLLDWPQSAQIWFAVMVVTFVALTVTTWLIAATVLSPTAVSSSQQPMHFLTSRLQRMREAVAQARSMPRWDLFSAIALSFLAHLLGVAAYICVAAALDLEIGILAFGWIRTTLMLVAMIPISLAGLGLRESASLLTLASYSISSNVSIAFSLLIAAVTVFSVGLLGGIVEGVRVVVGRRTPFRPG